MKQLSEVEVAFLRLRGMGPHDRLQIQFYLIGYPGFVGEPMTGEEALAWCLEHPLPSPTQRAIDLVLLGDSAWAKAESLVMGPV